MITTVQQVTLSGFDMVIACHLGRRRYLRYFDTYALSLGALVPPLDRGILLIKVK